MQRNSLLNPHETSNIPSFDKEDKREGDEKMEKEEEDADKKGREGENKESKRERAEEKEEAENEEGDNKEKDVEEGDNKKEDDGEEDDQEEDDVKVSRTVHVAIGRHLNARNMKDFFAWKCTLQKSRAIKGFMASGEITKGEIDRQMTTRYSPIQTTAPHV